MISQIRIYTINKGEMDNFLKHFKEDIVPLTVMRDVDPLKKLVELGTSDTQALFG